ncbi:hypothetical protein EON80_04395 [bacterium]|nr:MAG: hypothetical protein EON80_04395 [bacterium]
MKVRISTLLGLGLSIGATGAQAQTTAQERYAAVNRQLSSSRMIPIELSGYSTEGGLLKAYFKGDRPVKLAATFYGESGQALEEYYFWEGKLFFLLRTDSRYELHVMQKGSPGKITKYQERFYFQNGKLARWLDEKNVAQSVTSNEAKSKEKDTLDFAREMFAKVRNASSPVPFDMASVKARVASINQGLKKAQIVKGKLTPQDDEPGDYTAYLSAGQPVKIVTRYGFADGRAANEYYFTKGQLIFTLRNDWNYSISSGVKGSPGHVSLNQERFYFSQGRLARWMSDQGNWNELTTTGALKAHQDFLKEIKEVRTELQRKKK